MPSRSHTLASSFASATLRSIQTLSASFTISAVRGSSTTMESTPRACRHSVEQARALRSSTAPMTMGIDTSSRMAWPSASRSGQNANPKSTPARSPEASSTIGRTSFSVVSGGTVHLRMTSWPVRRCSPTARAAALMSSTMGW